VQVAAVVLAAGASRRLGRPKQLLVHGGRPLVLSAAECVLHSQAAACAVVVGAHACAVREALALAPIEILENTDFGEGVAASIRVAVGWARARDCQALLIALCDQPKLTAHHLDRLIDEYDRHGLPVASHYSGKNAVPALFPRTYFEDLAALSGDRGASALLNGGGPISSLPWPEGELDVDSPEAARNLLAMTDNTPLESS
jgi:CTP:molybdopterin cytidylyltransferase MocA